MGVVVGIPTVLVEVGLRKYVMALEAITPAVRLPQWQSIKPVNCVVSLCQDESRLIEWVLSAPALEI